MNPGTILLVVLGIIGLVLYAGAAFKKTKENFVAINDTELPLNNFSAENIQSLLGAFSTPDLVPNRPRASLASTIEPKAPVPNAAPPATALPVRRPPPEPKLEQTTESDKQGALIKKPSAAKAKPVEPKKKFFQPAPPIQTPRTITKKVYVPRACPPVPDLSEYVRKDSIPCFGCNLK